MTESPRNVETPWPALREPLTSVGAFFQRNHFPIPETPAEPWRLTVDHPEGGLQLDLDGLRRLGTQTVEAVLECAGNGRTLFDPVPPDTPWGLGAVGNARWSGAPLPILLDHVEVPPGTVEVYCEGVDRDHERGPYARSLPVEVARGGDALLAWEMNGEPLPQEHGGPVRLVVPGWYGMASVKWLRRIAFRRSPFDGHFQRGEYIFQPPEGPDRPVQQVGVRALIVQPADGAVVSQAVEISGWAWSGLAPVRAVEVEVDGLPLPALLGPDRGDRAWRSWRLRTDLTPGAHIISARAADASGRWQPQQARWNAAGYENNSAQRVSVTVQPEGHAL